MEFKKGDKVDWELWGEWKSGYTFNRKISDRYSILNDLEGDDTIAITARLRHTYKYKKGDSVDWLLSGEWKSGYSIHEGNACESCGAYKYTSVSITKDGTYWDASLGDIRPSQPAPINKVREILNKYLPTATIASAIHNELKPYIKS